MEDIQAVEQNQVVHFLVEDIQVDIQVEVVVEDNQVDIQVEVDIQVVEEDMLEEDIQVVEAVLDSLEVLHKDLEVD